MSSDFGAIEQEATTAVGENRQVLQQELERIRQDEDLSNAAKERYAGEASQKAEERHREIVAKHERSTAEALEQNERRVFGLTYPADSSVTTSQKEAFRASYREASFRCLNLPEEDLERVMRRAERTGDRALEQACYHEVVERGIFSVAKQYREKHKDAAEAWEKYSSGRRAADSHEALLGRALLSSGNPGAA